MSNRIGYIFHNNWKYFSPLLYIGNTYDDHIFNLEGFLKEHRKCNEHGRGFDADSAIVDFITYLKLNDTSSRLINIDENQLRETHEYPNLFDLGCVLVNISLNNYGEIKWDYRGGLEGNISKLCYDAYELNWYFKE